MQTILNCMFYNIEKMEKNRKSAYIIGISIIISSLIIGYSYAYSNRYSAEGYAIIDKWKQEIIKPKVK